MLTNEQKESALPHSIEAEQGLLACCMMDRACLLEAQTMGLLPEGFYRAQHEMIFAALLSLLRDERPIDEILLIERLKALKELDKVGGIEAIFEIQRRAESTGHFKYWAKLVLEDWKKRRMIRAAREMAELAHAPGDGFDEVRRAIQAPLTVVNSLSTQELEVGAAEEIAELIERKRKEFAGEIEEVPEEYRVFLGMPHNEEKLGWIDRRKTDNYIVIGAPSSRGKSTLMRQILNWNLQKHAHWKIAVFLMEGGREQFFHALACARAAIPNRKHADWMQMMASKGADSARKSAEKAKCYFAHLAWLQDQVDTRLFVFEKDRMIADIEARCKELDARLGGLDLAFVDYIQTVQSGKKGVNREQEVSHVSNRLQGLQVSLGCPLITGSQLNKDGEARESAQIFNDSTRFWRIERPHKDMNGNEQTDEGRKQYFQTLTQTKYRNGETGTVSYNFNTECGVFYDFHGIPDGMRGRPKKEKGDDAVDL